MKQLTFLFAFLCLYATAWAQKDAVVDKEFIDHKPQYRPWQNSYILDKIEYNKTRTILYFRFVCEADPMAAAFGGGTEAVFYPPGHNLAWYLKGKNVRKDFNMVEIRNVRRNGKMEKKVVDAEFRSPAFMDINTVFTCEVHFERLPNDLQFADLVEGRGKENDERHFNCFNVKLKTWDSKELGDEKDSDENIKRFNDRYGVKEPKKEKPKKEDPKKEDPKKEDPKKEDPKKEDPKKEDPKKVPPTVREKKDIRCGELMVADELKFQDNSTEFLGTANIQRTLIALLEYLHDHPAATLTVYGHTDIFGDKVKNLELSRKRALKIQRWFAEKGIPQRRVAAEWFGTTKPLFPEGNPQNRRVEILINCNK